jgi:hypothetical protein
VDLISSVKQISSASADFILVSTRISLYTVVEVIRMAENKLTDEIVKDYLHDYGVIRLMLISSINIVKANQ